MSTRIVQLSPGYYPSSSIGRPLALADIYVGEPDLDPEIVANQKTLSVLEEDGTIVAVTQPISTNAGGVPIYDGSPVTLLVVGNYSLKVLDSSGSQIYYVPSLGSYVVLPGEEFQAGNYYYPDYTEADQGAVGTNLSVFDILASVGAATKATMYFSHNSGAATTTYTFGTSEAITDNFNIIVEDGALISPAIAKTVTINGSLTAGPFQIFSGAGDIDFSDSVNTNFVYAEWWGAVGDGLTDSTTAIQAAIDAVYGVTALRGKVQLIGGEYISGQLVLYGGITLTGIGSMGASLGGEYSTVIKLKASTDDDLFVFTGDAVDFVHDVEISNMALDGNKANNAAGSAILGQTAAAADAHFGQNVKFRDLSIRNFKQHGISVVSRALPFHARDLFLWNNDGAGINFVPNDTTQQIVHLENVSGDGNATALVYIDNTLGSVSDIFRFTSIKAEKTADGKQESAIVIEEGNSCRVIVDGLSLIKSAGAVPNAAIQLTGATAPSYVACTGVVTRDGVTPVIDDDVNTITIPFTAENVFYVPATNAYGTPMFAGEVDVIIGNARRTVTGDRSLQLTGDAAALAFYAEGADADEKMFVWYIEDDGAGQGRMRFVTRTDADGAGANIITITRDGTAATHNFETAVTKNTVNVTTSTDALDVSAVNVVSVDATGGNVIIGGLAGGTDGQVVRIVKITSANDLTLENEEGTGTQKIITNDGADIVFSSYGGATLVYIATSGNWFVVSE